MMKHPAKCTVFVLLALSLLLPACTSAPAATEQAGPEEPIKLTVASLPFLSFAPFFIADEEGYFTEQGLEVEFVRFERGGDAVTALVSGDLDVWGGATSVNILNAIHSARIQVVGDRGYFPPGGCGYTAFLARDDLIEAGALDSPEQIRGLRVVEDRTGAMRDYLLNELLTDAGLTLDDIEAITLDDPVVIDAFADDSIDVAAMGEPWVTRIAQAGDALFWIPAEDVLPDYQFGLLVFGERLLDEEPEAGQRFMVAYMKAVRQYNEGKTERNLDIVARATDLDRDLLEEACWPSYRSDGMINADTIVAFEEWAVSNGFLEAPVAKEDFWNPAFVEYANQVLSKSE
jgi:NitT/TauT family transport system substrate-binding protein